MRPLGSCFIKTLGIYSSLMLLGVSSAAYGLFINGQGHYAARGEQRSHIISSGKSTSFRALEHNFRLLGETRVNDNSSFYLEFRLFDNPRTAYFGDSASPITPVDNTSQNSLEPGYTPYQPKITKASMRYAVTDMFILDVGRRERTWGLGALYNEATKPFELYPSVFDGVTFLVNAQEASPLSLGFGFDKITETKQQAQESSSLDTGSTNHSDDIDQLFLFLEYDSTINQSDWTNSNKIGIYGSKITSGSAASSGYESDVYLIDLYMKLLMENIKVNFELIKRGGKTADPHTVTLGGKQAATGETPVKNDTDSFGGLVEFEWLLSQTGGFIGPRDLKQGNLISHLLFANVAFAPGSSQGYYTDQTTGSTKTNREAKAEAMRFNFNMNPGLILFNGRNEEDSLKVDGIFDPARIMNTLCAWAGYRYESLESGAFEARLVFARLNESVPGEVQKHYEANESQNKPIGFYNKDLGTELDLKYTLPINQDFHVDLAAAAHFPGSAWKTQKDESPKNNYLLQVATTFQF